MRAPETQFATVHGRRIAYQESGRGDDTLLMMRARSVSIEAMWDHPAHLRLWRAIGERLRFVAFDYCGSGVSDALPPEQVGDLDIAVDDAIGLLDALGIDRACVSAEFDSAPVAVALAVAHPDRIGKLVLINGFAKGSRDDGYEVGLSRDEVEEFAVAVEQSWGTGTILSLAAPHLADEPGFPARQERLGARPSDAARIIRRNADVDVRSLLPQLSVPTLVVFSGDLSVVTADESRFLAEHIPGARFVEASSSTFYWGGGVVEEILGFLTEGAEPSAEHDLATVLFTDVVGSTDQLVAAGDREWRRTLTFLDELTESRADRFGGRVSARTGDGHVLDFPRPRDAVEAAFAIIRSARTLGVTLRAGLHAGEIERRERGDIGGLTVHIAARVAAEAAGDEVLVSRTVVDLLGASGYQIVPRGTHELKGVPGAWTLFALEPGDREPG